MTGEEINKEYIRNKIKSCRHDEELIWSIMKLCKKQYIEGLEQGHFDKFMDILELQSENKLLKNKVKRWKKRAHKSGFHADQLSCKNRNLSEELIKYKNITEEIKNMLNNEKNIFSYTMQIGKVYRLILDFILNKIAKIEEKYNA